MTQSQKMLFLVASRKLLNPTHLDDTARPRRAAETPFAPSARAGSALRASVETSVSSRWRISDLRLPPTRPQVIAKPQAADNASLLPNLSLIAHRFSLFAFCFLLMQKRHAGARRYRPSHPQGPQTGFLERFRLRPLRQICARDCCRNGVVGIIVSRFGQATITRHRPVNPRPIFRLACRSAICGSARAAEHIDETTDCTISAGLRRCRAYRASLPMFCTAATR